MRIPNMKTNCLLASDLSPLSSPKLNAHKLGCPRTMYKRQIMNGSCCELHTTGHRKLATSYLQPMCSHICLCII